ncbi:protein-methionine-sulfoxide reductase catalytic subunit MsrP [Amylibacter sp.]|nr:protein-methionine-sulfoxide reductase catalytic subunit MsrP [Amylibacter sp.]MDC0983491.1 protein-methionine-sulfoxide reductase catalytic subunit MsrP [Amylibacter sp.]MDG1946969.1 protein-methionine-sulfoxide reductase catalytic subunit MsrP [Amylibacter sp.]MDG2401684.1 protein-methionine-sulfoxide reductase catalytic subunit MsrP [Amylibacter sp.]
MALLKDKLRYSDITPKQIFLNRRQILTGSSAVGISSLLPNSAYADTLNYTKTNYAVDAEITSKSDATSYNNFYEFGTGKNDPKNNASMMKISPWSVQINGLVDKPGDYDLDDILSGIGLEERIYRFRCVEAWSMVVPWIGFSLSKILNKVGVQPSAKYVAFETLNRPSEMVGIGANPRFPWPYVEGLRLDEAMNPLAMIATGMYGESLPNQNGAPLRLVVPWKYGFKSIKSIVRISLTDSQPETTWNKLAPQEYGFYSNVNPNVDHPRWSQASERVIGGSIFKLGSPLFSGSKRETPMFNGYAEEVANLYSGMDLEKFY